MSSGLSNSCQTALALAEEYGGKVQVEDNHRISVTQRSSVLDAYAKVRGTINCMRREIEAMQHAAEGFRQKGQEIPVGAAGSFLHAEEDEAWMEMVRQAFPGEEVFCDPLSFSVGCHVGPDRPCH